MHQQKYLPLVAPETLAALALERNTMASIMNEANGNADDSLVPPSPVNVGGGALPQPGNPSNMLFGMPKSKARHGY